MLKDLIRFEWRYHTRQISFVAAAALLFFFGFALTATGFGPANVHVDSPYSIVQSVGVLSLMAVFILAVFCANAVVRDRENRMEEIVYSTSVDKFPFLFSRFFGSFLAAFTAFSASALGMFAARFLPNHDPLRVGDLDPQHYLGALLIMGLPNLFVAAVLIFAIATLTRSALASYVGSVFIYVLYFVVSALTNSPLMAATVAGRESPRFASLFDPFGLSAFFEQTKYWTPAERNTELVSLTGNFLINRLGWLVLGAAAWAAVYRLFAFRVMQGSRKAAKPAEASEAPTAARYLPVTTTTHSQWAAYASATRTEIRSFLSLPFLALTLLWAGLAASEIISTIDNGEYGSALHPTTGIVLSAIQLPLSIIATIVLIYFSAEVLWRERSVRMDGMLHATPSSSFVFVASKWTALCAAVAILIGIGTLAALGIQLAKGHTDIQPGLMLSFAWYAGAPLAVFAMAAVLIHTLSPHKYLGMLLVLLLAVIGRAGDFIGLNHPLWKFGFVPTASYSDMNGFRHFAAPFHWLLLQWALIGALFVVVAAATWRQPGSLRMRSLLGTRRARAIATAFAAAILLSGGHIFYNTNVLNAYTTSEEMAGWQAGYEKKYGRYASLPQPRIVAVTADVALYPEERRYRARGQYRLVNETAAPITRILVAVRRQARDVRLSLSSARLVENDERYGHIWFELERPLPPRGTAELNFDLTFANPGAVDFSPDNSVARNGSFLRSTRCLPAIGYRPGYELSNPFERRKYGLAEKHQSAAAFAAHGGEAFPPWVRLDLTLSTSNDQTAVGTGHLQRFWTANGRRHFHYRTDGVVPNEFAFVSARYDVARTLHGSIAIEVYYHPGHRYNVARMLRTAKDSLAWYEKNFGPYPHRQLKIVEVPEIWTGFSGIALPDMIYLGEQRGFLIDVKDGDRLDLVSRRLSHEIAHQWWGMQVTPAARPGATTIAESLTKYAELMILEHTYGRETLRKSLGYELDLYLTGRTNESEVEHSLHHADEEPYLYYRKGAIVMYALKDLLGEEAMNRALRDFMASKGGPGKLADTNDLLGHLHSVASDDQRRLIDEWMKEIVFYDLKVETANARRLPDGRYEVAMRIAAGKTRVDPATGAASMTPLRENLEIGVFASHPDAAVGSEHILYLAKHPIREGMNELKVTVSRQPAVVGIDPYILRIDRNRLDNLKATKEDG